MSGKQNCVEMFICAVEKQEPLWNLNNPDYNNVRKKRMIWQKIAGQFGISADACKKKWKALRSAYSRQIAIKRKSGIADLESSWKYFNRLDFLRGQQKARSKLTGLFENSDEPSLDVPSSEKRNFMIEDMFIEPALSSLSDYAEDLPTTSQQEHQNGYSLQRSLLDTMKTMQNFLEYPRSNPTELDEDELFFRSILKQIKRFPTKEKNHCKLQILSFVGEVENCLIEIGDIPEMKENKM